MSQTEAHIDGKILMKRMNGRKVEKLDTDEQVDTEIDKGVIDSWKDSRLNI